MRFSEFSRHVDVLSSEAPLFEIPFRKEYVLRQIGRGKRVLDLGCLGGRFSKLIKDQNNDVYGIEINPRAAEAASALGIKVKSFDLNDGIPFQDEYFDVVNAGQVLENIYDTKFLFEDCCRVLKHNGLFLFSVQNLNSLGNRLRVLKGEYLGSMGAYPEDHHGSRIRVFNVKKIQELCEQAGFQVLEIRGVPAIEKKFSYKVMKPIVRVAPQLAELLVVKARKEGN